MHSTFYLYILSMLDLFTFRQCAMFTILLVYNNLSV